jgi:alkyl hydroperoxide reductase subunit AhpF
MAIMSDSVREEVAQYLEGLDRPVAVHFYPKPDHPASDAMGELLDELARISPKIHVYREAGPPEPVPPETAGEIESSVTVIGLEGEKSGIRYLGFPGGHEFGAFLDVLKRVSTNAAFTLSPSTVEYLKGLKEPVHLQVFVTYT